MKRLFLIIALLSALGSYAQTPGSKVGRIEGEIGAGIGFGADKLNFDENRIGATFYAEGRYNLHRLPLDFGIQVAGTIFHRDADNAGALRFKSWNIMAVGDYNFRPDKKISFFAGIGLGYAILDRTAPISFDNSEHNWRGFRTGDKTGSFCFMPRIGAEFFHRLRLTLDYKLEEKANRHFGLSLGVVFGGGMKK